MIASFKAGRAAARRLRGSSPGEPSGSAAPPAQISPPFAVQRRNVGGAVWVALVGELDLASAPLADAELRDAGATGDVGGVVVDLSELSFIDCAGLGMVLAADARLREAGGRLTIAHSSRQVRRLFDLTGASARLDIASEPDALAAAPSRDHGGMVAAPGIADAR